MTITPTDRGAGFAGIMLAIIGWLSLFKMDHVAKLCHVDRWIKSDNLFNWITRNSSNKALALLFTEVCNFCIHGISNPSSVLFACGSTVVNALMLFVGLPLRQAIKAKKAVQIA